MIPLYAGCRARNPFVGFSYLPAVLYKTFSMVRSFLIAVLAALLMGCASSGDIPVNGAKNSPAQPLADSTTASLAKGQENRNLAQQLEAARAEAIQEMAATQREKEELAQQLDAALADTARQKRLDLQRAESRRLPQIDRGKAQARAPASVPEPLETLEDSFSSVRSTEQHGDQALSDDAKASTASLTQSDRPESVNITPPTVNDRSSRSGRDTRPLSVLLVLVAVAMVGYVLTKRWHTRSSKNGSKS